MEGVTKHTFRESNMNVSHGITINGQAPERAWHRSDPGQLAGGHKHPDTSGGASGASLTLQRSPFPGYKTQ